MAPDPNQLKLSPSPLAGEPLGIYLVLEGGGARGVAHVGTYCAIADTEHPDSQAIWPKIQIKGVAGTSVGALVAALIAVGYQPKQIISEDGTVELAQLLGVTSFDQVFRRNGLRHISRARDFMNSLRWRAFWSIWFIFKCTSYSFIVTMILYVAMILVGRLAEVPHTDAPNSFQLTPGEILAVLHKDWPLIGSVWLAAFIVAFAHGIKTLLKGLVPLSDLVGQLDRAFSVKVIDQLEVLQKARPDLFDRLRVQIEEIRRDGVRFKHLEHLGRRLRIVAADITRFRLETFSRTETPNVKISDAVGASIAIPVIFKNYHIKGRSTYNDGGLVSLLPAWAFDNLHEANPDAWVVAVALSDPDTPPPPSILRRCFRTLRIAIPRFIRIWFDRQIDPFRNFGGTISTTLYGRSNIDLRQRERVAPIRIQTHLKTLDFDRLKSRPTTRRARRSSKLAARLFLGEIFCNGPYRNHELCRIVADTIERLHLSGKLPIGGVVRVALARPHANGAFSRIVYARKFFRSGDFSAPLAHDRVPDDRILLPADTTDVGLAFKKGRPTIVSGNAIDQNKFASSEDYYRQVAKESIAIGERPVWRWTIPVHEQVFREDETDLRSPLIREGCPVSAGGGSSARLVLCIESNLDLKQFALLGESRYFYEVLFAAITFERIIRNAEDLSKLNVAAMADLVARESRRGGRRYFGGLRGAARS